jgi:hypothetical protein
MAEDNKLALWNRVQETNPFYTKEVGYGAFKFTSINAQYQLRLATEEFGMYGEGWGIRSIEYEFMPIGEQIMVLAKAVFFARNGTFPISSSIMAVSLSKTGTLKVDDEWAKKVETDITTKALSKLGFNADVFLGRYDDNRYVNDLKKKHAEVPQKYISDKIYSDVLPKLSEADKAGVKKIETWLKDFNMNDNKNKIEKLITARKAQL